MENLENTSNNSDTKIESSISAEKVNTTPTAEVIKKVESKVEAKAEVKSDSKSESKADIKSEHVASASTEKTAVAAVPERRPYPKPYVKPTRESRPYTPRTGTDNRQSPTGGYNGGANRTGGFNSKPGFNKGGFNSKFGGASKSKFGPKSNFKKPFDKNELELFTEVITVRRVTRVVKGGKRMRFAALVVVGDKKGTVGFANKKGMDFQDAVAKATKKAKENMIKIKMNENFSLPFSTITKFKAAKILLKPANKGTSLIAGGYVRPVLQLAGIQNIYSKIQGSNNKVVGVEAVINALKNYI
jgi:small subunit ribosomal protein S5